MKSYKKETLYLNTQIQLTENKEYYLYIFVQRSYFVQFHGFTGKN